MSSIGPWVERNYGLINNWCFRRRSGTASQGIWSYPMGGLNPSSNPPASDNPRPPCISAAWRSHRWGSAKVSGWSCNRGTAGILLSHLRKGGLCQLNNCIMYNGAAWRFDSYGRGRVSGCSWHSGTAGFLFWHFKSSSSSCNDCILYNGAAYRSHSHGRGKVRGR